MELNYFSVHILTILFVIIWAVMMTASIIILKLNAIIEYDNHEHVCSPVSIFLGTSKRGSTRVIQQLWLDKQRKENFTQYNDDNYDADEIERHYTISELFNYVISCITNSIKSIKDNYLVIMEEKLPSYKNSLFTEIEGIKNDVTKDYIDPLLHKVMNPHIKVFKTITTR